MEVLRKRRRQHPLADAGARGRQLHHVIDVEARQLLANALVQAALFEEVPVALCRRCEAARNPDTGLSERADHLAEGGVLAADRVEVVTAKTLKRDYIGVQDTSSKVGLLRASWGGTLGATRAGGIEAP